MSEDIAAAALERQVFRRLSPDMPEPFPVPCPANPMHYTDDPDGGPCSVCWDGIYRPDDDEVE